MIQFWFNLQEIQKRSLKLYRVKLYIFFKEDSFWCSDNDVVETDKKNKECITKNLSFFITRGDVRIPLFRKRSHDVHNVRTSSVHMASLAITSPPTSSPQINRSAKCVYREAHLNKGWNPRVRCAGAQPRYSNVPEASALWLSAKDSVGDL